MTNYLTNHMINYLTNHIIILYITKKYKTLILNNYNKYKINIKYCILYLSANLINLFNI